jgi:hypothetical protein
MRYTCSAAQNGVPITPQRLAWSLGTVCTAGLAGVGIVDTLRVKRVTMYAITPTSGTPATCSVNFISTATNPTSTVEFSDTTINAAVIASISVTPPKDTLASFWTNALSTVQLFGITCPSGTILDIDFDYITSDNEFTNAVVYTFAAPVVGAVYYMYLSNNATAFAPVSLTSTY